jgi:predicted P-loop ATPase
MATDDWVLDSPYVRAVAKRWLISELPVSISREHRWTASLEDHKAQKSKPCEPWPSDLTGTPTECSIGSKDALMEIAGVWIIEIAEFDALRRAASSTSKSFLTSQYDRFRPPWGAHMVRVPRQCIFAASINPPANGRYLKDSTGNRRIWPLPCGMIDIDAFTQVVDQLWAEAVHRYKAQEPWHTSKRRNS